MRLCNHSLLGRLLGTNGEGRGRGRVKRIGYQVMEMLRWRNQKGKRVGFDFDQSRLAQAFRAVMKNTPRRAIERGRRGEGGTRQYRAVKLR